MQTSFPLRKAFSAVLLSFNVKKPSSSDDAAAAAASSLISSAAARHALASSSSVFFKGSGQRSLPAFVTLICHDWFYKTKWKRFRLELFIKDVQEKELL